MKIPAQARSRHNQIHVSLALWVSHEVKSTLLRQKEPKPHWESGFTIGRKEFPIMTVEYHHELILVSASDIRYWFYNTPTEIYPGEVQRLVDIWRKALAAEKKRVRYWTKLLTPAIDLAIKRHKLMRIRK